MNEIKKDVIINMFLAVSMAMLSCFLIMEEQIIVSLATAVAAITIADKPMRVIFGTIGLYMRSKRGNRKSKA